MRIYLYKEAAWAATPRPLRWDDYPPSASTEFSYELSGSPGWKGDIVSYFCAKKNTNWSAETNFSWNSATQGGFVMWILTQKSSNVILLFLIEATLIPATGLVPLPGMLATELLNTCLSAQVSPQSSHPCLFSPGAPLGPAPHSLFYFSALHLPSGTILRICLFTCSLSLSQDCKIHEGRDFVCFLHCCTPNPWSST